VHAPQGYVKGTDVQTLSNHHSEGRLSLLTDLLQYPPTALFHNIKGGLEMPEELGATGDVISHLREMLFSVYRVVTQPDLHS
jgi:hypothetical protein